MTSLVRCCMVNCTARGGEATATRRSRFRVRKPNKAARRAPRGEEKLHLARPELRTPRLNDEEHLLVPDRRRPSLQGGRRSLEAAGGRRRRSPDPRRRGRGRRRCRRPTCTTTRTRCGTRRARRTRPPRGGAAGVACGSIIQALLDQKGTAATRAAAEGEREAAAGRLKRRDSLHQVNGLLDNPVFEPRGPKAEQHGLAAIGGFLAATMGGRRAASSSSSSSAARRAAARRRSSAREHQLEDEPPVEAEGSTTEGRMLTPERLAEPTAPRHPLDQHARRPARPRVRGAVVGGGALPRAAPMRTLPRAIREHAAAATHRHERRRRRQRRRRRPPTPPPTPPPPRAARRRTTRARRSCCSCTIPTAARRSARSSGGVRRRSTRSAAARRGASSSPASR